MYVKIDRKPESGCEIHTACCGRSGIPIRMKLVTGDVLVHDPFPFDTYAPSTKVTLLLVQS